MERLAQVLCRVVEQWGLRKSFSHVTLFGVWEKIVGGDLAKRCWPSSLRGGVLTVRVINSTWMQEIQFHKEEILKRIRLLPGHGDIMDLRFTIRGRTSARMKGDCRRWAGTLNRELAPDEELWIEGMLQRIKDSPLRAAVRRFLELHLKSRGLR